MTTFLLYILNYEIVPLHQEIRSPITLMRLVRGYESVNSFQIASNFDNSRKSFVLLTAKSHAKNRRRKTRHPRNFSYCMNLAPGSLKSGLCHKLASQNWFLHGITIKIQPDLHGLREIYQSPLTVCWDF
jgi:hypothetical protein